MIEMITGGMIGTVAMTNAITVANGTIDIGITTANTSANGAIINASAAGNSVGGSKGSPGLATH